MAPDDESGRAKIFDAKERTERYLDKLYDHTKQLATLSTVSAALFVSLYDGNLRSAGLLYPLLALAVSVACSMGALTLVTRMVASGEDYEAGFSASNWMGSVLWVLHLAAVVALLVGLVWFGWMAFYTEIPPDKGKGVG